MSQSLSSDVGTISDIYMGGSMGVETLTLKKKRCGVRGETAKEGSRITCIPDPYFNSEAPVHETLFFRDGAGTGRGGF